MTLVKLGAKLDACVLTLGKANGMSYAACVRLLCILGVRSLIRSGTFQGWTVPENLQEILDSQQMEIKVQTARKKREVQSSGEPEVANTSSVSAS